jgi:hypothetical protein
MRLLEDCETLREMKMTELWRLIEEGAASGLSGQDGEAFLDDLEVKYRASSERQAR